MTLGGQASREGHFFRFWGKEISFWVGDFTEGNVGLALGNFSAVFIVGEDWGCNRLAELELEAFVFVTRMYTQWL